VEDLEKLSKSLRKENEQLKAQQKEMERSRPKLLDGVSHYSKLIGKCATAV
jgi:peptidoglycan hydrolase CwlO-like protein